MNRAMSQFPCFIPDSFDKIASLPRQHFFCRVIRLPKSICESFDEVDSLPREDNRRAFFERHSNKCSPAGMHAKAQSCVSRMSH